VAEHFRLVSKELESFLFTPEKKNTAVIRPQGLGRRKCRKSNLGCANNIKIM
jgi:hypothetical protein